MAHSLHHGGTDLSGSTYGVTVLDGYSAAGAAGRVSVTNISGTHGGYATKDHHGDLSFSIPVAIHGTSKANLEDRKDALDLILMPDAEATLRLDDWRSDRLWNVRFAGYGPLNFRGAADLRTTLNFVAADPIAWATSATSTTLTINSDPDTNTTVVGGTANAFPVWTFKSTTEAGTNISIENTTTDEKVSWISTLQIGEWLRFTSARATMAVDKSTDSGTTWVNANVSLETTNEKTIPRLQANSTNSITTAGINNCDLLVAYTVRWYS